MSSTIGEAGKFYSSLTSTHVCYHFSLYEIQSATDDFDDELVIGKGGFGKVYKGSICIEETSHVVAIKRLDSMSNQGALEFRNEIEMLSKLRHCNLVSLIGFCDDNKEMILVYEYMPHGTLYHHLHAADTPLNWVQRLKVALGAARGLDYLHTGVGTQHGVIHRDVKSSNILLDENWAAMISDFGLSKVGPTNQSFSNVDVSVSVKGTFGYLDPEYFYTRRVTRKTDVFAFGVVLFELLSGRLAVDTRFDDDDQCSLVRWATKCVKEKKLYKLVDNNIRGTIFSKCLTRFAQLAYRCVHSVPKERPSMTEVVASLQLLLVLQEKHDNSAESSRKTGFTWKIQKYLVPPTKQIPDQSGTISRNISPVKEDGGDHVEMIPDQLGDLKKFTYAELQCATKNFANKSMGLDEVFKGWVDRITYSHSNDDTGLPIAIKRCGRYEKLDLNVLKEVSDHPNLVKLIGCCLRFQEIFLVYEFMPYEDLESFLHDRILLGYPLDIKVKIAVGIARGMVFLEKKRAEMVRKVHQLSESWFDRHMTFMDEDFKDNVGVSDDDCYEHFNPWSSKRPIQLQSYDVWGKTIDDYKLQRCKIMLDEDFTAKLSNYEGTDGVYVEDTYVHGDYYPGFEPKPPLILQHGVSGYTVVFIEVLIGRKIFDKRYLVKIDDYLREKGKKSLRLIAELCYEICNEVDSESRMLTILEEYEYHTQGMDDDFFL